MSLLGRYPLKLFKSVFCLNVAQNINVEIFRNNRVYYSQTFGSMKESFSVVICIDTTVRWTSF
jgi:hypothetical protein